MMSADSAADPPVNRRSVVLRAVAAAVLPPLLIGLGFLVTRAVRGASCSAGVAVDLAATPDGWADESRCIDCHEQAAEFGATGHANTLQRAETDDSLALLRQLSDSDIGRRDNVSILVDDADTVRGVRTADGLVNAVELDWCVGSGTHARTWICTLPDALGSTDLLEFRWTWFASSDSFVLTPGHPETTGRGTIAQLGLLFDGPRALRCFSCHATRVRAEDGAIDEQAIHPGVTCQRCHGPRARHVASDGEYHDPAWQITDRDEAVHRCAQCHRRADELDADQIDPHNADIARFQPAGLSQSLCFQRSQMTCTTCHDPHRPMERQDTRNIRQCVQCHDPEQPAHTTCGAGMSDGCLDCHMPAVEAVPGLPFTDHWIRVREESEPLR